MRILTWNCARGPLLKKRWVIDAYEPDVSVITEVPLPGGTLGVTAEANPGTSTLEFATGDFRMFGFGMWRARSFSVLGIWGQARPDGLRFTLAAIEPYLEQMKVGAWFVLGDFNAHPRFDYRTGRVKFSHLTEILRSVGLVSAYHAFTGEAHGSEKKPTLYYKNNPGRPYHLDYVFVPEYWRIENVQVPDVPLLASDHAPVVVDVVPR